MLLLNNNEPLKPNLMDTYQISDYHLIKGIPCPHCNKYSMNRIYKRWMCPNCSHLDNNSHIQVIFDYFLLGHHTITNQQCRELLQIDSPRTAYFILNSLNLKYQGNNKGRIYFAPDLEDFPQDSFLPLAQKSSIGLIRMLRAPLC